MASHVITKAPAMVAAPADLGSNFRPVLRIADGLALVADFVIVRPALAVEKHGGAKG